MLVVSILIKSHSALVEELFEELVKSEALIHVHTAFFVQFFVFSDLAHSLDIFDMNLLLAQVLKRLVKLALEVSDKLRLFNSCIL